MPPDCNWPVMRLLFSPEESSHAPPVPAVRIIRRPAFRNLKPCWIMAISCCPGRPMASITAFPNNLDRHRDQGRCLIANVSRGVLDQARLQYGPVTILHVTAPPEILAQRLAKRGRESETDIHARLSEGGFRPERVRPMWWKSIMPENWRMRPTVSWPRSIRFSANTALSGQRKPFKQPERLAFPRIAKQTEFFNIHRLIQQIG